MSQTVVEEIKTAALGKISTLLPTYSRLEYEWDLEKNNFQNKDSRYGFISLGADFVEPGITKKVLLDHVFQLILLTSFLNHDDDRAQSVAVEALFEATHDVLTSFVSDKLGLPNKVFLVSGTNIQEPEFIEDDTVVVVRTNLNVQYRYPVV